MRFSLPVRRLVAVATSGVVLLGVLASMSVTLEAGASGNLLALRNPSFELSVADVTGSPEYRNTQPLLPQHWTVEGSAGLFDHSQNGSHTGRRMAAISIPASGKRRMCDLNGVGGPCVENPAQFAKDNARQFYSANPAWRTLVPVNLTGASSYTVSSWISGEFLTAGEGPFVGVRWFNGEVPIGYSQIGPRTVGVSWELLRGTVFPPAGANRAHILLGHSDDTWAGQARFDDVCFGVC